MGIAIKNRGEIQKSSPNTTIHILKSFVSITTVILSVWAIRASGGSFMGLWLTPDQQGEWLMKKGNYEEAAKRFHEPARQGKAWYKDGKFNEAAAAFGRVASEEGFYNRGNALTMAGKYDAAISSYDRALDLKPGWEKAEANKAIAIARRDNMAPPEGDAGGIDGDFLGADDIVFDDRIKKSGGGRDQTMENDFQTSDKEFRAMWLRRLKTSPADFLKAKFAYQKSISQS